MKYTLHIVDVSVRHRFGVSQLAVLPGAAGISMGGLQIAPEFNFGDDSRRAAPNFI
jgi:hypothetical protein